MTRRDWCALLLFGVGPLLTGLGCSLNKPPVQKLDPEEEAKKKVEAFRRVADEMTKNPNGLDVAARLEEYRTISFDPREHPQESAEIMDIYRKRIQGRYQGDYPTQVQQEAAVVAAALKTGK